MIALCAMYCRGGCAASPSSATRPNTQVRNVAGVHRLVCDESHSGNGVQAVGRDDELGAALAAGGTHRWGAALCSSGPMLHDVQHIAVGGSDEEPANSPGLGAQRVNDLVAAPSCLLVGGVNVIDVH